MIGIDAAGNIICNYPKYVFVSSTTHTANLGGLAGADQICQDLASDAGLLGTFKAWLSAATQSPSTRFAHSATPYYLTDGTVIANNWGDLIDGTLDVPISLDENKSPVPPSNIRVWSATRADGTPLPPYYGYQDCDDWTSTSGYGYTGQTDITNDLWTGRQGFNLLTCSSDFHIYCFQQ
jgi:hypothetical protein